MSLIPRSLYGRLLALSLVATLAALAVAGVAIGGVLERFVTGTTDARLSDRVTALETAIRPDGTIDRTLLDRVVGHIPSGEPWRIDTPHARAGTKRSDGSYVVAFDDDPHYTDRPPPPPTRDGRPHPPEPLPADMRPFEARLSDGPGVQGLIADIATSAGSASVIAAVPRRVIENPVRAAFVPLALSLLCLGIALAAAAVIQLRIGLRPLGQLRTALGRVRAGETRHVPADQPAELQPLAAELNALIDQNEAQLAAARGHVANLAHGLKTPLAALAVKLGPANDPDGALAAEVARIDQAIRHHLGRARTDASGGERHATPLAPALAGLTGALGRIHADRGIALHLDVPDGLAVAVDPQDLDELLGNLLDNGWRWAASAISITARRDGAMARIEITDDGPGIPAADREAALAPGRRLDESGDGYGFGLAIARELAELHSGTLALAESDKGGLTAIVTLPLTGA